MIRVEESGLDLCEEERTKLMIGNYKNAAFSCLTSPCAITFIFTWLELYVIPRIIITYELYLHFCISIFSPIFLQWKINIPCPFRDHVMGKHFLLVLTCRILSVAIYFRMNEKTPKCKSLKKSLQSKMMNNIIIFNAHATEIR